MSRPQGVVVVTVRPAEDREHCVADELLARATEGLDRLDHGHQRVVDLAADVFGIVFGDKPDVVDQVSEERGDDATVARLDVNGGWSGAANGGPDAA